MSLDSAILRELREISKRLGPDPTPAFIDRDVLDKGTAVSAFKKIVDGGLEIDGKDFSQYIIQTDGTIGDISYRIRNINGRFTTEFEASRLPYVPGPVDVIQFKNDAAEAGKSIFVTKMKVPNLSAAPPPLPAEEPDPTFRVGGNVNIGYILAGKKNPVFITAVAFITSTNSIMTFESPGGTDYSVPPGKELFIYRQFFHAVAAGIEYQIGYGDDGVVNGVTDPTNPVFLTGINSLPVLITVAADDVEETDLLARVPAGKFPFLETAATNGNKASIILGVEVDA